MNYLFFDIECANCFDGTGKICEFGFVLTDENLNILKNGIFLVNPDAEFDWYVKHKIISYKISDYLKSQKYPNIYYNFIKELMEAPNTVCVGHGIKNDLKYLNDESKRYALPKLKIDFIDTSTIRKKFYNEKQTKGLKTIVNELKLGDPKSLHNSEYDAKMTLEYVRTMCFDSGLSFAQLIKKYSNFKTVPAVLGARS